MSIVYGIKSEDKYLGGFLRKDTAPNLEIQYKTGVNMPLVSASDFELWFGCKDLSKIGILCDFLEYSELREIEIMKSMIAVRPSADVKSNLIILDPKYRCIFGNSKTFKCLPVSGAIESRSIHVFLTSQVNIKVTNEFITSELRKIILGLIFTKSYNNITYEVVMPNGIITAKIHNVIIPCVVAEHSNFYLKTSDDVSITRSILYKRFDDPIGNANPAYTSGMPHCNTSECKKFPELGSIDTIPDLKGDDDSNISPQQLSFDFSKLKVGGLREQLKEIANVIRPRGINKQYLEIIGMDEC